MSNTSPRLALPYLQPSQAQKHVTHNEALQRLDTLVQMSVSAIGATDPPAIPTEGEAYVLGVSPNGAWVGRENEIAVWSNGAWNFMTPQPGWRLWDSATNRLMVCTGTGWSLPGTETQNLAGLGINTASDAVNRLAVKAVATLFDHEGAGHQLKINKAAAAQTAALLFQDNWSGRAEIGLAGTDDLSVKVSPDGGTWLTALSLNRMTGHATGEAVQQSLNDTTAGRLMRADYGYSRGNVLGTVAQSDGVPTGAVIETGSNTNGRYVRFADGTQICYTSNTVGVVTGELSGSLYRGEQSVIFPAAFAVKPGVTTSADSLVRWGNARAVTTTGFVLVHWNTLSSTASVSGGYVAIGRWY